MKTKSDEEETKNGSKKEEEERPAPFKKRFKSFGDLPKDDDHEETGHVSQESKPRHSSDEKGKGELKGKEKSLAIGEKKTSFPRKPISGMVFNRDNFLFEIPLTTAIGISISYPINLFIPRQIAETHFLGPDEFIGLGGEEGNQKTLILIDTGDYTEWEVNLAYYTFERCYMITRGWSELLTNHHSKDMDSLKFYKPDHHPHLDNSNYFFIHCYKRDDEDGNDEKGNSGKSRSCKGKSVNKPGDGGRSGGKCRRGEEARTDSDDEDEDYSPNYKGKNQKGNSGKWSSGKGKGVNNRSGDGGRTGKCKRGEEARTDSDDDDEDYSPYYRGKNQKGKFGKWRSGKGKGVNKRSGDGGRTGKCKRGEEARTDSDDDDEDYSPNYKGKNRKGNSGKWRSGKGKGVNKCSGDGGHIHEKKGTGITGGRRCKRGDDARADSDDEDEDCGNYKGKNEKDKFGKWLGRKGKSILIIGDEGRKHENKGSSTGRCKRGEEAKADTDNEDKDYSNYKGKNEKGNLVKWLGRKGKGGSSPGDGGHGNENKDAITGDRCKTGEEARADFDDKGEDCGNYTAKNEKGNFGKWLGRKGKTVKERGDQRNEGTSTDKWKRRGEEARTGNGDKDEEYSNYKGNDEKSRNGKGVNGHGDGSSKEHGMRFCFPVWKGKGVIGKSESDTDDWDPKVIRQTSSKGKQANAKVDRS